MFENVKGLTIGKHRSFLDTLIKVFEAAGYRVRIPWQVLNALNYGVPQNRQRLFLLGAKRDTAVPVYPEPTTAAEHDLFSRKGTKLNPTCLDALSDLPDIEQYEELMTTDSVEIKEWGSPSEYSSEMRCMVKDAWHYGYPRLWSTNLLTSSMRTVHTAISRKRFSATREGEVEPISRFFKLSRTGPSNTLRAGTDSARGAFTSPRPIHYKYDRCITVREMARLHGYPDWFRLHITKWHGARQIGNSVPPPLARAVASSIIKALDLVPTCPSRRLALGSLQLLAMDMGEAADYWKVPVPIQRRDRKNGMRKRKQSEIESLREGDTIRRVS